MRPHVDAPATIRPWAGRRERGSARPGAVADVPNELSAGVDIYGSLVTREATHWYVGFVPGLQKQWWHKFVHRTHKHVFAIRPLASGNWLLVEPWWTRLMIVVLPFADAMKYLRWGDAGDILKVEELIPGQGNQLRGWSNCAVLATFVLGRRSWSWLPHGLYKDLIKQGAERQDLNEMLKVYCERSVNNVLANATYIRKEQPTGTIENKLQQIGRDLLIAILSPELLRLCKAAIMESERFPEATNVFFESGMLTVVDRISQVLEAASAAGEVHIQDCTEAATLFMAMLRGNIHFETVLNLEPTPTIEEIERRTNATVKLFLDGL